eukprot:scaffold3479_cov106-Cylindrotheca_fusiformis.AAC.1
MTVKHLLQVLALTAAVMFHLSSAFVMPIRQHLHSKPLRLLAKMTSEEIKQQLQEYLETRKELKADDLAKLEKGRVVGGTKGNKVLDYISGAPVKEQILDRIPNVFDYDELTKYGYSSLITPIMELGGRRAVYELMDMQPPPLQAPPKKKSAPKLVIDRTGEGDKARYSGLKMGQLLDDDLMAEALERARKREKEGRELRPKLMEEEFEKPFAGKSHFDPPKNQCHYDATR